VSACLWQCVTTTLLRLQDHESVAHPSVLTMTNLLCAGGDNVLEIIESNGIDALESALLVRTQCTFQRLTARLLSSEHCAAPFFPSLPCLRDNQRFHADAVASLWLLYMA